MKLSTKVLPEAPEGELLIDHELYGWVIGKWNSRLATPGYEIVGFRPGVHEGVAAPILVMHMQPMDVARVKGWYAL